MTSFINPRKNLRRIPRTEKRRLIQKVLKEGPDEKFLDIEGISVVEERNRGKDGNYRCAEFVFRNCLNLPWRPVIRDPNFWKNPLDRLKRRGFYSPKTPKKGDVAVYGYIRQGGCSVRHFGHYDGKRVRSKFGTSHVFEHDVNAVPAKYGTGVTFIRKR